MHSTRLKTWSYVISIWFFSYYINKINHLLNLFSYILFKDFQIAPLTFFFAGAVLIIINYFGNVVQLVLFPESQQLACWHLLLDLNYWWGIFGSLGYISWIQHHWRLKYQQITLTLILCVGIWVKSGFDSRYPSTP